MDDILAKLKGGDRRSIGSSEDVVSEVCANPSLLAQLFAGWFDDDRVVRMRAADAVEKVTRERPWLLQPWKGQLLDSGCIVIDKEVRWHVAQMLPRLKLTPREKKAVVGILMSYLDDQSSIVKTFSMQALADLAKRDDRLLRQVRPLIERLTRTGTPAMRSRGRKLLKQLPRCE